MKKNSHRNPQGSGFFMEPLEKELPFIVRVTVIPFITLLVLVDCGNRGAGLEVPQVVCPEIC